MVVAISLRQVIQVGLLVGVLQGCGGHTVQRIDLRDPRLPADARHWLADAEDEVAIARGRVEDAETAVASMRAYRDLMAARVREVEARASTEALRSKAGALSTAMLTYAEERVRLKRLEAAAAETGLRLAEARLTLARAETAVRHDIAVYDLEPLVRRVEALRKEEAAARTAVEDQRAVVERAADTAWSTLARYARAGGDIDTFWSTS